VFTPEELQDLSCREDTSVILIAGGTEKLETIRCVLKNRLCNTWISDEGTIRELLKERTQGEYRDSVG